jgi:hypothetical protein
VVEADASRKGGIFLGAILAERASRDMAIPERVKAAMKKNGLTAVNSPKRTPNHPTKKGVVMAKEGDTYKLIRFGDANMTTAGNRKDEQSKERRASFRARHAKNIARGKMSAAYWADRELW